MKKECAYTRNSLRKYLRGHLFRHEQIRIARHLNTCQICRSEFQALKKVADTKQLLKEITPPESLRSRMKEGISGLARIKVILYRPLWLLAVTGLAALLYVAVVSGSRDVEIENIEKSLSAASYVASAPTATEDTAAAAPIVTQKTQKAAVQSESPAAGEVAPPSDPLNITVTSADLKTAIHQIREVMQEQSELRTVKLADTAKRISGSLAADDLLTFLDRIAGAGKINYSRKKLRSFPAAEPIPFVILMKSAPKAPEPAPLPAADPGSPETVPPETAPPAEPAP